MSHPRIAVFARLADGNAEPVRTIEGQASRLSRTMHAIDYDALHDEVVVSNPFAGAILFFRGTATGEEPPIRIIQGPNTYLEDVDEVTVDPRNDEVYVTSQQSLLVFGRKASGDAAPIRAIRGPKTRLTSPKRVAVDSVNNVIVVLQGRDPKGILIFDRTANGDVAPKAVISGPKTDIINPQALELDPERRLIVAAVSDAGHEHDAVPGWIGVWSYDDRGDTAPRAAIRGPATGLMRPRGVALNPKHREVYVVDMARNTLFMFAWPELFAGRVGR